MAFPSLLSEHEQKAFSVFLGQLAEEERSKPHNQPGHDYQHQPHPQQHQSHLQSNPILSSQHGPTSSNRVRPMPSDLPLSVSQQQQQQQEWAQQASANRLLASGSILDPQAMSQAFLQNPELMAQASAISQAMALAQQQQQQQQQIQLQIHAQEQMAHQQHNSNPNLHLHETRSQDLHPQPHQYQQHSTSELYPSYQQQQHQQHHHQQRDTQTSFHNGYPDPNMPMGIDPSFEAGSGPARTVKKRKSQTSLHGGHTSRSSGTPPPLPSNAGTIHPSTSSSYVSTSPTGFYESEQMAYFKQGEDSTPPSKKPARRKESSGNDYPYVSSSPHHRTGQRSSHDGHDSGYSAGSGVAARRKTSEPSSYVVSGRHSRDGSEEMVHGNEYNYHPQPHMHHNNGDYSNSMGMNYTAGQNIEGGEAMMPKHHSSNINRHPYSDDQDDPSRALSPQQNNSLNQMQPRGPGKKQPHELLTDAEKKANHIASEQKRRQNIRIGFDSLVEIVPTLSECQRSEALILQKSVDYIQRLLDQKNELKSRVRDLQVNLGENADGDESASEMEFEE